MKKVLLSILALCCTAFSVRVLAASETFTDAQGVEYTTLSASTAVVSGFTGTKGNITIPGIIIGGSNELEYDVIYIGKNAFKNNQIIESINLPARIDSICEGAFEGCKMLYRVHFEEGSGLQEIRPYAFYNCTGLVDINIPARKVSEHGDVSTYPYIRKNAFYNVPNISYPLEIDEQRPPSGYKDWGIKKDRMNCPVEGYLVYTTEAKTTVKLCSTAAKGAIVIPDRVTALPSPGFQNCAHITALSIPAGIAMVGSRIFCGCNGLQSIICNCEVPPVSDYYIESLPEFAGVDKSIPVYVPEASIDAYAAADGWKQFTNWQKITEEVIEETKYTVTLNVNDEAMGTVTGAGKYDGGSDVIISATPNAGYKFLNWSDGETETPRTIKLTSDTTITAVFADNAVNQFTLTLLVNDPTMGVVTGGGAYDEGATANFAAAALTGYIFKQWSDGNKEAVRSIVMTQNVTLTATFGVPTFKVTLAVNDATMGSVEGAGEYNQGAKVTIKAIAKDGFQFVKWSDENKEAIREITVDKDINLTATFEALPAKTYTITATAEDPTMGTVTGGGVYGENASVTLLATPNDGFEFSKWSDGVTDNPRTFVATADSSFVAVFIERESPDEGLEDIQTTVQGVKKIVIDGQLYILRENAIYDARGKRVK